MGDPTWDTPLNFVADVNEPRDVLRLVILLNNMILEMISLLYQVELAVINKRGDAEILRIVKSHNKYHMN